MGITTSFIYSEIRNQSYEISLHADDDERIADGLTVAQLESVLLNCQILEQYTDDPRGESCLVLGFTGDGTPVHVVCGKNRSGHLILVTVYIPTMPKWCAPYTRSR
ncbi:MAG: DUF4258 domain-containing protein [Candidatus Brocadiales bacterium]